MNSTKTKLALLIGAAIILVAGLVFMQQKRASAARAAATQAAKIADAVNRIEQVNTNRPDPQVQAKSLIFAAFIQKKIPAAANWCDTLNAGGKLWPVTPTNTAFAINPRVAGRSFSRTQPLPGDVVVFFQTTNSGWNLTGGPELLADNPKGVAVALADGRAITVTPQESAGLRWNP